MKFHYTTQALPALGLYVLAAWTNGDEFDVIPSTWDGKDWTSQEGPAEDGFYVYAWAAWPAAPVMEHETARWKLTSILGWLLNCAKGPRRRFCTVCNRGDWVLGWPDEAVYFCSDACQDAWGSIPF